MANGSAWPGPASVQGIADAARMAAMTAPGFG
jgi:hypothetical protein